MENTEAHNKGPGRPKIFETEEEQKAAKRKSNREHAKRRRATLKAVERKLEEQVAELSKGPDHLALLREKNEAKELENKAKEMDMFKETVQDVSSLTRAMQTHTGKAVDKTHETLRAFMKLNSSKSSEDINKNPPASVTAGYQNPPAGNGNKVESDGGEEFDAELDDDRKLPIKDSDGINFDDEESVDNDHEKYLENMGVQKDPVSCGNKSGNDDEEGVSVVKAKRFSTGRSKKEKLTRRHLVCNKTRLSK
jgi:hypothetical protein